MAPSATVSSGGNTSSDVTGLPGWPPFTVSAVASASGPKRASILTVPALRPVASPRSGGAFEMVATAVSALALALVGWQWNALYLYSVHLLRRVQHHLLAKAFSA